MSGDELVCNYDDDVTPLYAMLASLYWDEARMRCQTHPLEAQTWVIRRDKAGKIRWKLLPLHAAIIFNAPLTVIECLLNEYPKAAREQDDKGLLPLHLACRQKEDDKVAAVLLEEYPQGVSIRDRQNRLPADLMSDDRTFSKHFIKAYSKAYSKFHESTQMEAAKAVNRVKMDSMKKAHEERMLAMEKEYKQKMRHLKQEMLQEQHELTVQHDQEMDDLRDLLAREVSSGQTSQLKAEVGSLQRALTEVTEESNELRSRLRQHKTYEAELQDQIRKLLGDQRIIHGFCKDQQRQLEEAQRFREQVLSSLLVKEDGRSADKSREMGELSAQLEFRTEQLLRTAHGY